MNEIKLRGAWQREQAARLLAGETVKPFAMKGKGGEYRRHYVRSFNRVVKALEEAGYSVKTRLGPRGGRYAQVFWIDFEAWKEWI